MGFSWRLFPLGSCLFAVAMLVQPSVVSAQTFRFPDDATPTEFQGFVTTAPSSVGTWSCVPGSTHTTHSTWAACCVAGEDCQFFTECNAGTATRMDGSTYVCATNIPNCYTMTIYQSYPSAALSWSAVGCVQPGFNASTVYREIVVGTTPTPSPGSSTISTGTTPSAIPSTPVETGARESANTSQPSSPTSQAWIAGAVIGPVAAVALAAFLAFWLGRRKGRRELEEEIPQSHVGSPDFESATMQSTVSPTTVKSEPAGITAIAELADYRTLELDSLPVNSPNGTRGYEIKREDSW
ncbi:uncharacterized protein B0H64DRAFT_393861 [Chaetomium fimeti]|uniref:Mid2 domain-containing protein n=1 Tax=Chaetomium fimeti TaxID=1854472 RepID=A0AAE0HKD6_9PEZI|nr:hypothetical protein B0H64DRAFT_393861 [Chaetomium fimeti]